MINLLFRRTLSRSGTTFCTAAYFSISAHFNCEVVLRLRFSEEIIVPCAEALAVVFLRILQYLHDARFLDTPVSGLKHVVLW